MALLGAGFVAAAAEPEKPRHVLVVHSYHQGMAWADGVTLGLQEHLRDRAELVFLYLDVKRFPGPGRDQAMAAELAACAARCQPRLIVTVDDFAYDFVIRRRSELFPGCPVVFCGVNYPAATRPPGVTGVVEAIDLSATLRLAFALQPQARRLVVVNDLTETGLANRRAFDAMRTELADREILHLGDGTFAETEARLAQLDPRQDLVLLLSWNRDRRGAVRTYEAAISQARGATAAGVYGVWSFYFGHGLVGGYLIDGRTHGLEAGELALAILDGRDPNELPIVARCRTKAAVDARELRRLGIPRDRLPPGVDVDFEARSLWAEHAGLLVGILAVLVLQGVSIGLLAVALANRKRAEARAQASKEQLRLTIESSSDAVIATDLHATIVLLNPVAAQLFGCPPGGGVGRPVWEVVDFRDPAGAGPFAPAVHVAVLRDHAVLAGTPAVARQPDGGLRQVSFSAAPIRDAAGATVGMVLVVRDVTRQHHLEEQVRQAQKMESVGLLAGGVAHDFNNILQVIEGNLSILEIQPGIGPGPLEFIGEIRHASRRAVNLTRQLLAFGRKQQMVTRELDLAEVVEGLSKMLRRLISAEITIECTPAKGRHFVNADPGQIEQVLLNLCVNARDAMPQGGTLRIGLEPVDVSAESVAAGGPGRPGRYVALVVTDTGTGMDAATAARIFEPFFTTKPTGRGTGLGLSVVQGIVQQHGGFVGVTSMPGAGTTFRIHFPAVARAARPPVGASPEGAGERLAPRASGTIVLADDDESVRRTVCMILQKLGFEVIAVSDGVEACAVVAAHEGPLVAVVLDVVMPRMRGTEAAGRIAACRPEVPVVLCSGYPGSLAQDPALDPRWRWLPKPFQVADLTRLIGEIAAG